MTTSKKTAPKAKSTFLKLGLAAVLGALALTAVAAPASAYEGRPAMGRPAEGRGFRNFGRNEGRGFARGGYGSICAPRVREGRWHFGRRW
jgi:hypothetical protein